MIFHLLGREEWAAARAAGCYAPASLDRDGFIHCSTRAQLAATANAWFRGRRDLVALCIDEARLAVPLRQEAPRAPGDARAAERFPHLYGPLAPEAVIEVVEFPCGIDGAFELPLALRRLP